MRKQIKIKNQAVLKEYAAKLKAQDYPIPQGKEYFRKALDDLDPGFFSRILSSSYVINCLLQRVCQNGLINRNRR